MEMDELFEKTKVASYFIWEYTQADNALALWACAEDTANFLDFSGIYDPERITDILHKGIYSLEYISFVRHIAYRLYIYINCEKEETNWFAAEKLLRNDEWRAAITEIAKIYNENKSNFDKLSIRSDIVKKNYSEI